MSDNISPSFYLTTFEKIKKHHMDIATLNWLAIIVATVITFVLGGLWYGPLLFGKAWLKENNLTEEDMKNGNNLKIFGFAFLWSFVMAFNLAMFLNQKTTTASWGATAGFLAGFGRCAVLRGWRRR